MVMRAAALQTLTLCSRPEATNTIQGATAALLPMGSPAPHFSAGDPFRNLPFRRPLEAAVEISDGHVALTSRRTG